MSSSAEKPSLPAEIFSAAKAAHPRNWRTGFWSLIVTQFQGAFSEQALKNLIIFIIFDLGLSQAQKNNLVPIVMVLFALPFIVFSMAGGFLADRFSKRSVTIGTKIFEIGSATCALAGLALQNLPLEFLAIFLLDTQGAVFGPSKYGLLPEILPEERLSWGNGIIELGTFLAIISGAIAGGYLSDTFRGKQQWSGALLIALAIFGTLMSMGISRVPVANPARKFHLNFITELWREMREIKKDHILWLAVMGNTYFWFLGALLQPIIILYGKDVLHLSDTRNGLLQAALAIGIGIGSVAAGYLSGEKIEYGLVPLGAFGLTVFCIALAASHLTFASVLALLALLGFFGGFFAVPVNALIQHRPEVEHRGAVLAVAGVLSFIGIGPVAAGAYYLFTNVLYLSPAQVFMVGAGLTFVATIGAIVLLPDSLLRLLLWFATHSMYRIHIEGRENIPERGGALFIANRMSLVDALLLTASTERHIHFVMDEDVSQTFVTRLIAKMAGFIQPTPSRQMCEPRIRDERNEPHGIVHTIQRGHILCVSRAEFEAAKISGLANAENGQVNGIPCVLVELSGTDAGPLHIESGRLTWRFPQHILCCVKLHFSPAERLSAARNSATSPAHHII